MKVAVVGAGIIGASIAYHMAQDGVKVSVFDAATPGQAASAKSFGWINASFAETDAYFDLRLRAVRTWKVLEADVGFGAAIQWHGALWWEDQGADFDRQVAEVQRRGYPHELLSQAGFAAREPLVATPPNQAILGLEEAGADGTRVTQALLEKAGVQVHASTPVEQIELDGDLVALTLSGGVEQFDHVVVATGACSGELLEQIGVSLPMDNQSGILVQTTPLPRIIRHIIMTPDVHFRQLACGRILMGEIFSGGNLGGRSPQDFAGDMLDRMKAWLPAAKDAKVETVLTGLRPVPQDGLPAVGPVAPQIYVATMHSGITLAPVIGKLVAGELQGQNSPDLDPFRPTRFS